ncbi:MAG: hypothetical protein OM95_12770 [Bdellovibrio sp. ArHS]|uniref:hypothetical protein n=1 Tax=Bdellovibrio sp. ArHS TaxID=1569284 RepID=UPI000583FCAA|nr:hypothetical protein [Bdellovibrio sp. ArHS]KHD87861.1 MAG: hypothetical protein OM95_12770 [Bdellovibrio sp. ArHS]
MNIRNVILILAGTVIVSVTTALVTVRLIQPSQTAETTIAQVPTLPASAPSATLKPSAPTPPPPPTPVVAPTTAVQKSVPTEPPGPSLDSLLPPKEFDPHYDGRKPLHPDEVVKTLLKNTPSCEDDYKELCVQNRFLAEHPLACLRSQKEKLSRACASQVGAVQDKFKADCSSDIQKFCSEQRRYFSCLKAKFNELSKNCQANIKEHSRK